MLFKARFIEPILNGQKVTTWRVKQPACKVGDVIPCQSTGMRVFARVKVLDIALCYYTFSEEEVHRDGFLDVADAYKFWDPFTKLRHWKITFELVKPQVEGQ